MRIKHLLVLPLLLIFVRTGSASITYRIVDDPGGLRFGFGFSGTITTDGSIGSFMDASAITSWDILFLSPGFNDGVTSQTLNESNSTVVFSPLTTHILSLTSESITVLDGFLSFQTPLSGSRAEAIVFFDTPTVSRVELSDLSEPRISFVDLPTVGSAALVANFESQTAVPEPSGLLLALTGVAGLGLLSFRQRRRTQRQQPFAGCC